MTRSIRNDVISVGLLLATVAVMAVPTLSGRLPALRGDTLNDVLPRMIAVAREIQRGGIPLWDFHTFAGAKPFYADEAAILFYPVLWIFYRAVDVADPAQCALVLIFIPFFLHAFCTALGAYVFARLHLGLGRPASFLAGLGWVLSPAFLLLAETVGDAFLFSYFPWALLCLGEFLRHGSRRWWISGVVVFALMNSARGANYQIRIYFVGGIIAGILWLCAPREHGCGPDRTGRFTLRSCYRLVATAGMMLLGAALLGFAWAGIWEGINWIGNAVPMTHESASDLRWESSMPPMYLVTLLVPGFFGILDSKHAWGTALAEGVSNLSALGGGLLLLTAAATAVLRLFRRPARPSSPGAARESDARHGILRAWTVIALVLVIGGLVTMMGRYTPVFRWLCACLPWFFRIPHAVYYRFAVCWGLVILAAIGADTWMQAGKGERTARFAWWIPVALVVTAAVAGGAALLVPVSMSATSGDALRMPAYETLHWFHNWGWFLRGPAAGFVVAALWALLALAWRCGRARAYWLFSGLCLERVAIGVILLYVSVTEVQQRKPGEATAIPQQRRIHSLADFQPYKLGRTLDSLIGEEPMRWTCVTAAVDNQAWSTDRRALLGTSAKPLFPEFQVLLGRFTRGTPYVPLIEAVPIHFFRNMSVRFIAYCRGDSTPLERVAETGSYVVDRVDNPLPYIYTQDHVVQTDKNTALKRLFETDLSRAAYVCSAPPTGSNREPHAKDDRLRFDALQATNRVRRMVQLSSNRLSLEVDMQKPAMLVLNECWHPGWRAMVDGVRQPVWKVNGLVLGVWLEEGTHRVEWRFFPPSMRYGLIVTIAACVALGMAVFWPRKGISPRRH
jgi:hypothetical protein